jgi:hypothetical protein
MAQQPSTRSQSVQNTICGAEGTIPDHSTMRDRSHECVQYRTVFLDRVHTGFLASIADLNDIIDRGFLPEGYSLPIVRGFARFWDSIERTLMIDMAGDYNPFDLCPHCDPTLVLLDRCRAARRAALREQIEKDQRIGRNTAVSEIGGVLRAHQIDEDTIKSIMDTLRRQP